MRKSIIVIIALTISAVLISSCKYEKGPVLSFRTKKNRITGIWRLKDMTGNRNINNPLCINNPDKLILNDDGTGFVYYNPVNPLLPAAPPFYFEWDFIEKKENIQIRARDDYNNIWYVWTDNKILKLKNSKLWLEINSDPYQSSSQTVCIMKFKKE